MNVTTELRRVAAIATSVAALLFVLVACAPRALANTVTYDLTVDHCSGGCGTSPFGSVALTTSGTSVDVVVTLFNGNEFVKTGSGDNEAFKFDASSGITNSDITITSPASPVLQVNGPGSYDGDGTGDYTFGISCPTCGMGASGKFAGPIDFTVSNATIADLTIANSDGFFFTADILSGTTGKTGPVAASGPVSAPEPSAATLLGMVLAGFLAIGLFGRRRLVA